MTEDYFKIIYSFLPIVGFHGYNATVEPNYYHENGKLNTGVFEKLDF